MTGDALLQVLATLASPHRMRVVAALAEERNYVSQLARNLGIVDTQYMTYLHGKKP